MSRLRIAIAGAAGRMGRALAQAVSERSDLVVVAGTEHGDALSAALGFPLVPDPGAAMALAEVWVDFTTPAATLSALSALPVSGVRAAVIGTTGFTAADEAAISAAAQHTTIVKSGNFSLGVAVLCALVEQAARALPPTYDIEIQEAHHRAKVDAPSGTALMLGEAAATGRGASLGALRLPPHDGVTGPRPEGGIGFAVTRGGGIVGSHAVALAGPREMLTLQHDAFDRSVFADGALAAALWAKDQPAGLYELKDVLGL
jgi:4-hydroxy-tetrahydrodipicolinate reductase